MAHSIIALKSKEEGMEDKNYEFDAKQARQWANNPLILVKRIYKLISEAAHEGMTNFTFEMEHPSAAAVNGIYANLINNGFQVKMECEGQLLTAPIMFDEPNYSIFLTISW